MKETVPLVSWLGAGDTPAMPKRFTLVNFAKVPLLPFQHRAAPTPILVGIPRIGLDRLWGRNMKIRHVQSFQKWEASGSRLNGYSRAYRASLRQSPLGGVEQLVLFNGGPLTASTLHFES